MRRTLFALLTTAAVLVAGGCSGSSDEAPATTTTAATDMTLDEYLKSHGVAVVAQTAADLKGVRIAVQQPPNWFVDSAFQLPNTFAVIADTRATSEGFTPNATVLVHRLTGDIDPAEAIRRGPVDTTRYPGFRQDSVQIGTRDGDPSSTIRGSYDDGKGRRLAVSSTYVIHSGAQQRLAVQLLVTTTEKQAQTLRGDVQTLVDGLKITDV